MRTVKVLLVVFILAVLATNIVSAEIITKTPNKAVTKLGSAAQSSNIANTGHSTKIPAKTITKAEADASVNNSSSIVSAVNSTKVLAKTNVMPKVNSSLNQSSNLSTKNLTKTFKKSEANASVNQSNILGPNLALHRHANTSSLYFSDSQFNASKGVDGSLTTIFHTKKESNPWWQVDLGRSYPLSEAIIYSRKDCCQENERTLMLLVSNDSINWRLVYNNIKDNGGEIFGLHGDPLHISLKGIQARFVRLQLQEKKLFHLAEVEIYGTTNPSQSVTPKASSGSYH